MLDNADNAAVRTQVYGWNGFGFSDVTDGKLAKRCAEDYGVGPE
jgi:hypothetical protein